MIIKLIPETDAEKAKHKEVTFENVKEFFLFGNRKDAEDYMVEFHEWEGSHRYLIGSLNYFYEEINDERRDGSSNRGAQIPLQITGNQSPPMIKRGEVKTPNLELINPHPDEEDLEYNKDEDINEAFPENDGENEEEEKVTDIRNVDVEKLIKNANKRRNEGE